MYNFGVCPDGVIHIPWSVLANQSVVLYAAGKLATGHVHSVPGRVENIG